MANSESKTEQKAAAKAAPKKAAAAKPAKTAVEKNPAAKAAAKKPAAAKSPASTGPSAEERYRMTEVAAYFMAERNNFAGSPVEYWQAAEAQINNMLGQK